jgi:hypothetical protein
MKSSKPQQYEPENGATYLAKAQFYNAIGDSVNYDQQTYQALVSKDLDVASKVEVLADYARHLLVAKDSSARTENLFKVLIEQHPNEPQIRMLFSDYLAAKDDMKGAAEQMDYAVSSSRMAAQSDCVYRRFIVFDYFVPVWPKPPAPRSVSSRASTACQTTVSWRAITIWQMRSPCSIVCGSLLRFTIITPMSPR